VRDLEGALDVEKSAGNEANKAINRLTKQIRELEHSYDEERKNGKELGVKLERYVINGVFFKVKSKFSKLSHFDLFH
jgi:hypothetical protein